MPHEKSRENVVDLARSRNMAAIKGINTKPELIVRRGLHARGYRFRLHDKRISGCPDITLRKYSAVVFVNGCFWHLHKCHLFKWPRTRESFWRSKLEANRSRDLRNIRILREEGWRVATIWECALKGSGRAPHSEVLDSLCKWLESAAPEIDIAAVA
nr:very short patch repair endonuclease [uncultured Roseibium sp.]